MNIKFNDLTKNSASYGCQIHIKLHIEKFVWKELEKSIKRIKLSRI